MARKNLAVLAILLPAAAFGLLHLTYSFYLDYDSGIYGVTGRNWVQGKGFTLGGYPMTLFPHGYPLLYRLLYPFCSNLEFIGKFWAFLTLLGTVFLVYLLAEEIFGKDTACLAALLIGTHGFILEIYARLYADNLFIFLLFLGLYITQRLLNKKPHPLAPSPQAGRGKYAGAIHELPLLVLLALVGAALTWTKPEGLLFFGLQLLIILIFLRKRWLMRFVSVGLAGLLFLAALFPYLSFLHQHTGRWQLSRKMALNVRMQSFADRRDWLEFERITFALNPDKKTILGYQGPDPASWTALLGDWPVIKRRLIFNIVETVKIFWRQGEIWLVLALLALAALLIGRRKLVGASRETQDSVPLLRPGHYLLLAAWLPLGVLLFFHIEKRLLLPYMMMAALFMAHGAVCLYGRLRDKFPAGRMLGIALLAGLLVFSVYDTNKNVIKRAFRAKSAVPAARVDFDKALALEIKAQVENIDRETVVAMHPVYGFYTGADFLHLPYTENLEDLLLFMRNNRARYLLLTAPKIKDHRPLLLPLLEPEKAPQALEPVPLKPAGERERQFLHNLNKTWILYKLK